MCSHGHSPIWLSFVRAPPHIPRAENSESNEEHADTCAHRAKPSTAATPQRKEERPPEPYMAPSSAGHRVSPHKERTKRQLDTRPPVRPRTALARPTWAGDRASGSYCGCRQPRPSGSPRSRRGASRNEANGHDPPSPMPQNGAPRPSPSKRHRPLEAQAIRGRGGYTCTAGQLAVLKADIR